MDEEALKPKKINVGSFFESIKIGSIVADRAFQLNLKRILHQLNE